MRLPLVAAIVVSLLLALGFLLLLEARSSAPPTEAVKVTTAPPAVPG